MWFTIGGSAACASAVYLLPENTLSICAAVCVFLFAAAAILSFVWSRVKPFAAAFLGAAALFIWTLTFQSYYLAPVKALDGETVNLSITLTDYSWDTDYGIGVEGYAEFDGKPYRIRAYVDDELTLKPGDTVIGSFRLRDTTGGHEEATYHMGNGIYLLAYPKGQIYHRYSPDIPWYGYPAFLADYIRELIHSTFPADTLAFAQALLLGDTGLIDYETDTAFKLSGIRHIVAVSGLHVSILFALVYYLSGRRKLLSILIGIPVLILFAAVAGFTPSITRACIMHGLMMLAILFEREYDAPSALSFAVLVMLICNPYSISSVSLQLSAGCICGILLFSGRINGWLMDKKRLGHYKGKLGRFAGWLSSSVSVSLSATLITTPLCALYFGTVSLVSVLTNLMTLWVVTFIFYGIIISCILGAIYLPMGAVSAWIFSWPMRYVLLVAKLLASLPLAAVYTCSIYIVLWLILCYCLLSAFLLMERKRPLPLLCTVVLGLCFALTASWAEPLTDDVRMTVLDVGQGQCIILQSEGKTFLVDCGGDSDTIAADAAAEQLLSMGISRLNGIILTHYDRDHAGGIANLLTRLDTDVLYLPECVDAEGTSEQLFVLENAMLVEDHTRITFGDTSITLYTTDFGTTSNESGLCVLFQRENCDILITGDRNAYGERDLLRQTALPDLEVLIVGHHGSKSSTCIELLEAGRPDIAIISVGDNSYGHPTQQVLDRLTDFGCEIYRTDENGTVIYRR